MIAANRQKHSYLTQTLGYLSHELNSTHIPVFVCFVEEKANKEVKELQRLNIDFLFLYQNRTFPKLPYGKSDERIAKESNDYWTCLQKINKIGKPKFVLILEDDVITLPKFADQLHSLMYQLEFDEKKQHIDYVKLFHPWYLRKVPSYIQVTHSLYTLFKGFRLDYCVH